MAHFAELDESNTVLRVIVVANETLIDQDGKEQEALGQAFIAKTLKLNGVWKQTSYNAATNGFRGKYAGIGDKYDAELDEFVSPTTEVAE